MPLVHSEKIEETSTLLVWKLTETEEELLLLMTEGHNLDDLNHISHPQKRREWLASRNLIKIITEQSVGDYEGTYKDDHGKVYLSNNQAHISITHTYDYVAAILDPTNQVGIDMEKLDAKLQRTAGKFLNEPEHDHANGDLRLLAIYWCAKEAIYKLYGRTKVSFKEDIRISPFYADDSILRGSVNGGHEIVHAQFHVRWFEDYCLAIAV
jgi:4'-phosphopantetheinyl transferase